MITLAQANAAHHGQTFYGFGNDRTRVIRVRKSGQVKTWKTRPNDWQMPVKFGLYESAYIISPTMSAWVTNGTSADNWYMTEDEATAVLQSRTVKRNPRRTYRERTGRAYNRYYADTVLVSELAQYIENDGDLYRQKTTPIIKNLQRKIKRGVYDPQLALKLWGYLADEGAQRYHKEFNMTGKWFDTFRPADRAAAARQLAEYYTEHVNENPRRERLNAFEAREILRRWAIVPGTDFHAIQPSKLAELTEEARKVGYHKHRHASGSTAREFYRYLEKIIAKEPLRYGHGTLTAKRNPSGVRIVYNKLLGGWYVVRGPHQTPLSGRFESKAEAAASLQRPRPTSLKSNPRGRFVICAHAGRNTLYYRHTSGSFIESTANATHYRQRALAERAAKSILNRLPNAITSLSVKPV
jgi:hypothetical protein